MINKRGGLAEPKTGEILALITAPSYDPSILLVDNVLKTILIVRLHCKTTLRQRSFS
jgi:cell division protein FtsI/penicillin-binding protein 2